MNISEYFSRGYSYFFNQVQSSEKEEAIPFIDLEIGKEAETKIAMKKEDCPGSIRILSKEIFTQERGLLVDPPQAPGTAAGESVYFMPRQHFLLDEKYQDRNAHTVRIIGNVIYDNLTKAEPLTGLPSTIDLRTAADIGILSSDKTLTSEVDNTKTKMGKGYLQLILARPSSDLELLDSRQKIIKSLLGNPSVLIELRDLLQKMGETEIHLLSCWDSEKQLPGSTAGLYYRLSPRLNSTFNNSALALDVSAVATTAKKVINTAIQGLSGLALATFAVTETSRALTGSETPEWLSDYADRFVGATPAGPVGTLALAINNPLLNVATAATVSALCLTSIANTYGWMKADTAMLPLMRGILSSVATHYRCLKSIYQTLKDNPEITRGLEHFSKIEDFITNKEELKELETLFGLLDSFSFNEGNDYFFRPGEVLLAWELLHSSTFKKKKKDKTSESPAANEAPKALAPGDNIRDAFAKVIPAIGEVDVFLSTAQLMLDSLHSEDSRVHYCFPTFMEDSAMPQLRIKNVWNPRIGKARAIPNDILLGGTASQGMNITGPNTGGKSCLGQGIMAAAIMAQSLGIAPGDSMELTPFAYMRTSMDIQGSIQDSASLFAAQSKSIAQIQEGVKALSESSAFSLTVLDEPFSGTNAEAATNLVIGVGESLTKTASNLSVIVTHFSEAAIELSKSSSYASYQVKDDGSYTLQEGVYQGSNAFETAEAWGISSEAIKVAKRGYTRV